MSIDYRPMDFKLHFYIIFSLIFFSLIAADLAGDEAALMAFRAAVGQLVLPWNTSVSYCLWSGITCADNRVASLRLPGTGLIGEIPHGILGNLSSLYTLSLRFNALSGRLPFDLIRCKQLRNLYIQGNRFSGEIPIFLSSITGLVRLNLAENKFSGEIPRALNNLTRLATLYLERNLLSGEIPELDLPNVVQFNVSFNQLNGSVPLMLRSMPENSFLGMALCGRRLGSCPGEILHSDTTTGTESGDNKLSGGVIAGITIGSITVLIVVAVILFLICSIKGKPSSPDQNDEAKPLESEIALTNNRALSSVGSKKQLVFFGNGPRIYDLEDLLRASAEVLGKGAFGTTYKAVLETGEMVAVKRLREANTVEKEFREKVEAIGAMDHPNLVRLLGYYYSMDEKLLVYDYMPTGSLSSYLHGNRVSGHTPLNWEMRTCIALSAARGLEYIHSTAMAATHGNIKSSNVLLTTLSEARLSDHCLAHIAGAPSSSIAGYRAPEVTNARKVSQKADVYSFGILLLELLTGKAPSHALLEEEEEEEGVDLPRWVQSVVQDEWTADVFDRELLRYPNEKDDMVKLLRLALSCAAQYPDDRLAMPEVSARIEAIYLSSIAHSSRE